MLQLKVCMYVLENFSLTLNINCRVMTSAENGGSVGSKFLPQN